MAPRKPKLKKITQREVCSFEIFKIESPKKEDEYILSFHIPSYLLPEEVKKKAKKK